MTTSDTTPGAAAGAPRLLLRLEGLALLGAAAGAYAWLDLSWALFALCFLLPDLAFLAYLAGPRAGAAAYNATHSTLGPLALGAAGLALDQPLARGLALVWLAHVGFDRALGYGLKYADSFGRTHLGRIGRRG